MSQGSLRAYPFVMSHGEGSWAFDVDGNLFLDFTSGIGVTTTGHSHPRVVAAVRDQLERFLHISSALSSYEVVVELADRLARRAPVEQPARVVFSNSGTEANEAAVKLARWTTQRPYLLAFLGGFHGRTMGSLALSAVMAGHRSRMGPLMPGVFHLPYPHASSEWSTDRVMALMESLFLSLVPPDEVAAVIVEPIQGGAGVVRFADDLLPRLRDLADSHGFLLILDEVYSGMGRTGRLWAIEHWGVQPDIICFAKGVASGLPLGGIIARAGLIDWPPGTHSSTFAANPLSCAAALATLQVLEEEGLIENAARLGTQVLTRLEELTQLPLGPIAHVCGKGLMIGLEMQNDEIARLLLRRAFEQGLLLLPAGGHGVRLAPPLVITDEEIATGLELLTSSLEDLA